MIDQRPIWDAEYSNNKNKWHRETISLPPILKDKEVLELGVGNGKTLKAILRQNVKQVIAIDFSSEAIAIAESMFHNKKLEFFNASLTSLPFKDNTFDVIVCYYVLNNLLEPERKEAIQEIYRTLKPKGILLFEDLAVGDFRETEKKHKKIETHTIEHKSGLICHFFSEDELTFLFKDFPRVRLLEKSSNPIKGKPKLKRRILSGYVSK